MAVVTTVFNQKPSSLIKRTVDAAALVNSKLAAVIRDDLVLHIAYTGSILQIATLAKGLLCYILMIVFLTRKRIPYRFVTAGGARWFHQHFYKNLRHI